MSTLADLAIEQRGDVVVARVDGEIDRSNARDIAAALLDAVPNVALGLVLDLSATTYIDSSGVHLIFEVASRLKRRQQQVRAVAAEDTNVRRLLSVVALDRTVPLHATLEEAVAESLAHPGPGL